MQRNNDLSIALVGGGQITQAMVRGLLAAGYCAKRILVCTPSPERQKQYIEQLKVIATDDNSLATRFADVVIIAVRPETVPQVCTEMAEAMLQTRQQKLVISLAEGVAHARLREMLSGTNRVVCAVPNLAVKLRRGMTGLYTTPDCSFQDTETANNVMSSLGETLWVQHEKQLANVEATSGTSPAYLFYILEQMQNIAEERGLSDEEAKHSVLQAAWGAISLAMSSKQSLSELRMSAMQSKAGAESAVDILSGANVSDTIRKAMTSVEQKTYDRIRTESN